LPSSSNFSAIHVSPRLLSLVCRETVFGEDWPGTGIWTMKLRIISFEEKSENTPK
jgi:hypothetical protein